MTIYENRFFVNPLLDAVGPAGQSIDFYGIFRYNKETMAKGTEKW